MPLVVIQHEADRELDYVVGRLSKEMPGIVARALDVEENPDARLTPDDVEVHVQKSGEFDTNTKDLEIVIWANEYPERLRNLDERKDRMVKEVRAFLVEYRSIRNISGFVWILLQPAAFGEL